MKTPAYWNSSNLISNLLLPLGKIYAAATALRVRKASRKADCPVICVGNLTAGGTGKTPTAIAIAGILQKNGYNPYFVSRGYGGKRQGIIVDPMRHSARDVGDEPLLLARQAEVSINAERYLAAQKAVEKGADVVIMDDGFQNPTLYKDLGLLVFDGGFGIGNGRPIPAGPLRESLENGLKRADAAIILGEDRYNLCKRLGDIPVFYGKIAAHCPQDVSRPGIAFAGIGRPEKFYQSLRECQIELLETINFPDHHFYQTEELQTIIDKARQQNADIYTTAKDYVKIPTELQPYFQILEIEIIWDNPEKFEDFILNRLARIRQI